MKQSDERHYLEIALAFLTGILKFLIVDVLDIRILFIIIAILGWSGYIFFRIKKDKSILVKWGFTTKNLKQSFIYSTLFAAIAITGFVIYGMSTGQLIVSWTLIPVLLLYPIWGIIQHFLTMSMVAGNLGALSHPRFSNFSIIIITSILFGFVHYPNPLLMIGTFILAIFYTIIFLKTRNVWPLGLYHGWIGGFFYYFVLGIDIWKDTF